ncbi:MAG: alpha-glucan family phosphorylase [Gammaproteobacteria bacterium]|nr:alpha-glucan family phosphorylase [Gammaproteobacteria bacterium]
MAGRSFPLKVEPRLPDEIARLEELATNFWFSWHRPTRQLFYSLDQDLWWRVGRNPRLFLSCIDQARLDNAAVNETFMAQYRKVLAEFDAYVEKQLDGYSPAQIENKDLIAYFCAEYGYHESFPIYSGGLGILAGDHCKTASDLCLPFVGVGLLYRRGYFVQSIDGHGDQHADYVNLEAGDVPVHAVAGKNGEPLQIKCRIRGRDVQVKIWEASVGRVPVLLLDTDIPDNEPSLREITRVLYGGGEERRIEQEIILGIGGVKALRATGRAPGIWHINEGHAAFQMIERVRELVGEGLKFDAALEAVAASTVFTTHTPVAAGHDVFHRDLVLAYFREFIGELGISEEKFLRLGADGHSGHEFNMTRLAISGARDINGVSRIHGKVSAEICASAWPEVPARENPVGFVTNGVHVPTFLEQEWTDLFDEQLGSGWGGQLMSKELSEGIEGIPDGRFWYAHQRVKSNMFAALRTRLERQYARNNVSDAHVHRMLKYIDPDNPDVLTIGFARRFATYKRATLLFHDLGWLRQIVDADERPVVFIFAGKAHPADEPGQGLLREIHRISNEPGFVGKVILVEGYDMGLGRLMTGGVDVWLNTPIAPLEASGTSGMKAAINGTVNLSVLDGWWAEAYDGTNGWGMPPSSATDPGERDREDAQTLYETLQDEVIPQYYARDEKEGLSPKWVARSKRSMVTVLPHFNSRRVLHDYLVGYYGPAARQGAALAADNYAAARELAEWKRRVHKAWPSVSLQLVQATQPSIPVDAGLPIEVKVGLGGLSPADIRVECVLHREICSEVIVPVKRYSKHGPVEDGMRDLDDGVVMVLPFEPDEKNSSGGSCQYRLDLQSPWTGALRYEIRAVPTHASLAHPYETGLMRWL